MSHAQSRLASATPPAAVTDTREEKLGVVLVALSAVVWSFGGAIARYLDDTDSWTMVFWRSSWAAAFLIAFMLWRDGPRGSIALIRNMGVPGLLVAGCFAVASTSFVVALAYTTVANIVLINAGVPLIAALMSWILFRERISGATWAAIAAVILGVAIMVSNALTGSGSVIGNALAVTIALVFALATVITRRFSHVRMTPATCLGTMIAAAFAFTQANSLAVTLPETGFLFAFGALNLGLGLALFATGARLVPSALAALLGTLETVLGPVWVWLIHSEVPSARTIVGGSIVFAALIVHLGLEFRRQARPRKPGVTGVQTPH